MKPLAESVAASLALIRAKLEIAKGNWSRYPAGSSKGGQFAPKGQTGFGGSTPGFMFPGTGSLFKPKETPKGAGSHPKKDENGKPVTIDYPSKASDRSTWRNKNATATWTPGSPTPALLHGVPMKPWAAPTTTEGWAKVSGQNPKLDERLPFVPSPGKSVGAGVVIMEPDGRVWLTKPTNEFGGYKHTFPKGTAEPGLTLQQNAIKEAYEESGLRVQIVGVLGDFERTTSKARFYLARRVGGTPSDMGWETQAMRLAPLKNANSLLNMAHDRSIISNVKGVRIVKAAAPKAGAWQKQPRWPAGTALGGQWKSYDGAGLTMPPKLGSASNPAYGKAADAAYQAMKSGDNSVAAKVAQKFAPAAAAYSASGGKGLNYHAKEGAKTYQYAIDLLAAQNAGLSAGAKAASSEGPLKLSSLTQTGGKPGGSNPGGMYKDASGNEYLVKGNAQLVQGNVTAAQSDDRAKNEVLASKLMQAVGVGAPDMTIVDLEGKHGGGIGVASKWMQGQDFDPNNKLHVALAQKDFAVHAWLANYDVVGLSFDNLKMVGGQAVNIDPGGALLFRAQGLPKKDFSTSATEIDSMRDASKNPAAAKVYGSMTQGQLKASAEQLGKISDDQIKQLVNAHGPGDQAAKDKLAETLIKRKQYILGYAGLSPDGSTPASSTAAKPAARVSAPGVAAQSVGSTPAPAAAPKPLAATSSNIVEAKYSYQAGNSNKFWSVSVNGNTMVTHYGKIGSEGSVTVKTFGSSGEASAAASKAIGEKLKKGYGYDGKGPVAAKVAAAHGAPAPAASPAATPKVTAPQAVSAPPPGQPAPPSPVLTTANKTIAAAAKALHEDGIEGKMPSVKITAQGTIISSPTLGTRITIGNPPKSAAGKALLDYANATIAHVTATQSAQAKAPSPQVVAATQVGAAAATPMAMPAKPPAAKLSSAANPNTTLIAKVDKIATIADDFAAGKLSKDTALAMVGELKFGSNSYGKTASAYQQSVAAAISGGKVDAVGNHAANAAMPQQAPLASSGSPKGSSKKPAFSPSKLSEPPSFVKWGTTGKPGPSSSAAVNQANEDAVQAILQAGKTGKISAVEGLKIPVIDKTTGAVTGSVPALEHPSQWVKGYAQQVINEIDQQLNPPKKFRLDGGNPVAALSSSYPTHKGSLTGTAVKKLGYYVVLGEPGTIDNAAVGITSTATFKSGKLTEATYASTARTLIAKMPKQQADAVKSYTGSGYKAINGSLWKGNPTGAAKAAAEALKTLSHDIQPGTILSRKLTLDGKDLQDMIKAQGKILQEPGVSSTSISPDVWGGNVHLKMTVGPGVKGLYVGHGSNPGGGSFSNHGSEKEMLLPPNTRMLVQRVMQQDHKDKDGFNSGSYRVEVLILPTD